MCCSIHQFLPSRFRSSVRCPIECCCGNRLCRTLRDPSNLSFLSKNKGLRTNIIMLKDSNFIIIEKSGLIIAPLYIYRYCIFIVKLWIGLVITLINATFKSLDFAQLTDRIKLVKLRPCSHLSLPSHVSFLMSPLVASFSCLKALAKSCTASYMSAGSIRSCEGLSRPHSFLCFSTVRCTIGSSGSISRTPVKLTPEYWYGSKSRVCRSCTHAHTHCHVFHLRA